MLIHREYSNAYPSMFMIYKDRVETKNANKPIFIGQLLPGKFEPFPKNPNIAQIFTQMGRSEELGTGVKNVFKYSKVYSGSDHIVFEENDVFIAKVLLSDAIYNTDDHAGKPEERMGEGVNERINELSRTEADVYLVLFELPGSTQQMIADKLNLSEQHVRKIIKKLKEKQIIKRVGSNKTGYWEFL